MAIPALDPRYAADRIIQRQLMAQAEREALAVLPDLAGLSRDEAAGVVRTAARGLMDRYRAVAEVAAAERYARIRRGLVPNASEIALQPNGVLPSELLDNVVDAVMARWVDGNQDSVRKVFANKIGTRSVDSYRESVLSLTNQDRVSVQAVRTASPSACIYCQSNSGQVISSYADEVYALEGDEAAFHDNCTCIIEVQF